MNQQDLAILEEIGRKRPNAIQKANDSGRSDAERQRYIKFLLHCNQVVRNLQEKWTNEANWF